MHRIRPSISVTRRREDDEKVVLPGARGRLSRIGLLTDEGGSQLSQPWAWFSPFVPYHTSHGPNQWLRSRCLDSNNYPSLPLANSCISHASRLLPRPGLSAPASRPDLEISQGGSCSLEAKPSSSLSDWVGAVDDGNPRKAPWHVPVPASVVQFRPLVQCWWARPIERCAKVANAARMLNQGLPESPLQEL